MRNATIILICAAVGLLSGAARPVAAVAPDSGVELYRAKGCAACHGTVGQGGSAGPKLAPAPKPYAAFLKQLRRPLNQMPPYSVAMLSDAEAQQIHTYLAGIKPGRSAAQIPALAPRRVSK